MSEDTNNKPVNSTIIPDEKDLLITQTVIELHNEKHLITINPNLSVGKWLEIIDINLPMLNTLMKVNRKGDDKMQAVLDFSEIPVKNLNNYRMSMIRSCIINPPFDTNRLDAISPTVYFKLCELVRNNYSLPSFLGL